MKAMKRRLLSLLLAMAMVCTLVPTALASTGNTGTDTGTSGGDGNQQPPTPPTYTVEINAGQASSNTIAVTATVKADGQAVQDLTGFNFQWTSISGTTQTLNGSSVTYTNTTGNAITQNVTCSISGTGTASSNSLPITIPAATLVATSITLGSPTLTFTAGDTTKKSSTVTVEDQFGTAMTGQTITVDGQSTSTKNGVTATVSGSTIEVTPTATATVTSTKFTIASGNKNTELTVTINPVAVKSTLTATTPVTNGNTKVSTATLTITSGTVTNVVFSCTNPAVTIGSPNQAVIGSAPISTNISYAGTGTIKITATMYNGATTGTPVDTKDVNIDFTGVPTVYIGIGNSTSVATSCSLDGIGSEATLYAYVNGVKNDTTNYTYNWEITSGNSITVTTGIYSNYPYQTVRGIAVGTTYVKVTVYPKNSTTPLDTVTIPVTVGNSGLQVSVTVYGGADYQLSDVDDKGASSVVNQIAQMVRNTNYSRYLNYVVFTSTPSSVYGDLSANTYTNYYADGITSTTGGRLSDVVFTPKQAGTAYFSFRAYYYNGTNYGTPGANDYINGTLAITVTNDSATGDIPYTASIGDDVYFDMGDFEDFYYSKTSRGTLDRVTFTMPSGGYLYSDRSRLSSSNATCYVSPRSTENDLGSVYFSPTGTTASRAGTVRVGFTAYGNRSNVSGTVAITYLNGAAKDITYSTVGGSVTLDHQDFIDAYKEVTGKTAPSNLTIQFQEVPSNGTLTYTGGSRDVDLTKSNVRSNKYSTKTTGSYRLNQLTYTGTRGTDTIEYIAYSGSAAQFTGKVVFNGTAAVPTDVVVTYGSTGGQAVLFSQNDFVRANSVMSNAVKVRFVVPTNGTLTMNGANAAGIDIASSLLGSVSYKPKAGFNGTDRIIFAAYDSRNQLAASGSVNITVVGNTGTSTTPGGVTDVSQFKDVSSTAWYRNDLATLVSQGIITGKGEGKFDPLGTVTYGEALKMILEACGYTATLGTGSNWAINYKNLAVSNGWISSSIELNAAISRNATAELAARVMGVAPATSGSPFADEANAYAVALYYTNPQIFVGDNTTGKLLFKNGSPLLRQEVCAVICRVRNYHTQHTTNTMPDGI